MPDLLRPVLVPSPQEIHILTKWERVCFMDTIAGGVACEGRSYTILFITGAIGESFFKRYSLGFYDSSNIFQVSVTEISLCCCCFGIPRYCLAVMRWNAWWVTLTLAFGGTERWVPSLLHHSSPNIASEHSCPEYVLLIASSYTSYCFYRTKCRTWSSMKVQMRKRLNVLKSFSGPRPTLLAELQRFTLLNYA